MGNKKEKLKECHECWMQIESHLKICPYCNEKVKDNIKEQKSFFKKLFRKMI